MTREQAKELLPIMQAFVEGKAIQFRTKNRPWFDLLDNKLEICELFEYRIKPEPKYRPFKTQEECWNEMLKHQPFGWVRSKKNKALLLSLTSINKENISIIYDCYKFPRAFESLEFTDGTPFGIKEE